MSRTRFPPDRGLTMRMLTTMGLLGLLYVVFAAVLVALLKSAVLAVLIIGGLFFAQYWFSDRAALFAMRARVVSPEEAPELHAMVDRLCAMADMPKPQVAIAETDLPNAFAAGRSPGHAVVCVTTGIQQRLEAEELESVLAHELSHVAHRDVAVITLAAFLGVLAGLLVRFGLYSEVYGGVGGGRRRNDQDSLAAVVLVVVLVSAVVYGLAFMLTRALSRYRELSADRSAALLTGRPSALASALTKISGEMARIPSRDLRQVEAFNAFFFTPAIAQGFSLSTLFSTHPSLRRRLDQLGELSRAYGRPG